MGESTRPPLREVYNTDPAQTPRELVTINGNLRVEGVVYATKCVEVPGGVQPVGP